MSYVLGIDTSNYTTSVALIDEDFKIICDNRKLIKVKEGMKGIRQSEALFQHIENLPELLDEVLTNYRGNIKSVAVSTRPRPVTGSYMPVFKAGINAAKIISSALGIPLIKTSHQEGHIAAGIYPDCQPDINPIAFHLSGGTTEIIFENQIIGGTKDISIGQLLDRIGVSLGLPFPAGKKLDEIASDSLRRAKSTADIKQAALEKFKYIAMDGNFINLSGIDSQVSRMIAADASQEELDNIVTSVFYLISHCLKTLTTNVKKQYNVGDVLYVGGVSSSEFIRSYLKDQGIIFAGPELSVDNAVGVAVVGGRQTWR